MFSLREFQPTGRAQSRIDDRSHYQQIQELYYQEQSLDYQRRMTSLQLRFLQQTDDKPIERDDYVLELQNIKNDFFISYGVYLKARDYIYEEGSLIELDKKKQEQLITQFEPTLDEKRQPFLDFTIPKEEEEKNKLIQQLTEQYNKLLAEKEAAFETKATLADALQTRNSKSLFTQRPDKEMQALAENYPLSAACLNKNFRLIRELIGQRPSKKKQTEFVNQLDSDGQTALHKACALGSLMMIHILLEAGARRELIDKDDYRPIHYLTINSHFNTDELLTLLQADPNAKDSERRKRSPLHVACQFNNKKAVIWLLSHNVDLDQQDELENIPHRTALHYAAEKGNLDIIRLLLDSDANPRILNVKEESPLYEAIFNNHKAAALEFVKRGCWLDQKEFKMLAKENKNHPHIGSLMGELLQEQLGNWAQLSAIKQLSPRP
jgi:ankyrin repeat protein